MVTQPGTGRTQVCQVSRDQRVRCEPTVSTRVFKTVSDSLHSPQGLGLVNTLSRLSAGQLRFSSAQCPGHTHLALLMPRRHCEPLCQAVLGGEAGSLELATSFHCRARLWTVSLWTSVS